MVGAHGLTAEQIRALLADIDAVRTAKGVIEHDLMGKDAQQNLQLAEVPGLQADGASRSDPRTGTNGKGEEMDRLAIFRPPGSAKST